MSTVLALLQPLDPVTGARVDLRVSNAADRDAQGWNGERWWPAILEAPKLSVSLFEDELNGQASSKAEGIKLSLGVLRNADQNVGRFVWAKAPVTIYLHDGTDASVIFQGRAGDFSADNTGALSVSLEINEEPFGAQVLSQTYDGNGGAEGPPELKGRLKPWLFGRAVNVEPVLIDSVNSVYQCSGYGPIDAVAACYERGGSFGAAVGDYADYAALVAADLQPGQWGTCLAQGMIRLGAPAAGLITVDADGDNTGGFWRKTGEIIARLASAGGVSGQIASGTLTALDTAVPRNIALYLTEQTTLLEVAQRLAAPCNAVAGVNLLGELFVARIAFGTAAITLDAQARQLPPVAFFGEEPVRAPYKRVMLGAARTWRVQTFDEIAFEAALYERGIYDAATLYYEGNIVTRGDGSRWLFVSTTAQSGITPGSDDIVWAQLAPANALNATGPYSATTTYSVGDIVLWGKDSYVRIGSGDTTGTDPTDGTKWALFVQGGVDGTDGTDGVDGQNGLLSEFVWKRASAQPTTPTGDGIPTGWSDDPPADDGNPLWMSTAKQNLDGTLAAGAVWSTPVPMDGDPGPAGYNNANVFIYQRAASVPALPSAATTYDFAAKSLTGLDNGWSTTIPAGSDPLYVSVATASAQASTDTIAANEWSSAVILAQDGTSASAGLNSASVFLYQRAASAPSVPSATVTYTFADGTASGVNNGWSRTIPANDGNPIWITQATAASTSPTDTISTGEWATPQILAQDGSQGPAGYNNAQVLIYQRAASAPALPTASTTYTFATKALTGLNNGWSTTIPAGSNPLYVAAAVASSQSATDSIAANEWSTPVVLAQNGTNGTTGLNSAPVFLYQRAASQPAVPSTNTTYTFASGAISGQNNGWLAAIPANDGNPVWVTTAAAASTSATDTIAAGEWAAPQILAQDGIDGTNGNDGTDGQDAYSVSPPSFATTVAADPAGVVKSGELPKTVTFTVKVGVTDISTDALTTYSVATSGCSASMGGTNNRVLTISAVGDDTSTATVTIKYNGVTISTVDVTITKAKQGYSADSDSTTSITKPTATTYGAASTPTISVLASPGQTVAFGASLRYTTSTNAQEYGKFQYRTSSDGVTWSSWSDVSPGEAAGDVITSAEPGFLAFNRSITNGATKLFYQAQLLLRLSYDTVSTTTGTVSLQASA